MNGNPESRVALVCTNIDCANAGAANLIEGLKQRLSGQENEVPVEPYNCFGDCPFNSPIIVLYPEGIWFTRIQRDDLDRIADHILGRQPAEDLVYTGEPKLQNLMNEIIKQERHSEHWRQ